MIQDIAPHRLDNSFQQRQAKEENLVFCFQGTKILLCCDQNDQLRFPRMDQLPEDIQQLKAHSVYAFSVDEEPMFLILDGIGASLPADMGYYDLKKLYEVQPRWAALAGVTAGHLNHWYNEHRYCGCCGSRMKHGKWERAMVCPQCKNIQYPRISPVIMAAVTDGERLMVTRYAGREYKGLALIAGFVEIGESLESALKREVREEVGLEVCDLTYFGSQPWGFSDSVISGFFARLSGDGRVKMDRDELSEAVWIPRDQLPEQSSRISITAAMIEAFRKGEK